MSYDAIFREAISLPAEQQTRLVFELAGRLGINLRREVAGELRKRIQDRGAAIEERGGPQIARQLDEVGAPRQGKP